MNDVTINRDSRSHPLGDCIFCLDNRKSFLAAHGYDPRSMYFYEDRDFSLSVDLSPMVPGHLLAIPVEHVTCMGAVDEVVLQRIYTTAVKVLNAEDILIFEHGAVLEGEGGASVDHAHMHIMPKPAGLDIGTIDKYVCACSEIDARGFAADNMKLRSLWLKQQPYIYFNLAGDGFAYRAGRIPHQFLRKMLQPYTNICYNWHVAYQLDQCRANVAASVRFIKSRNNYV